MTTTFFEDSVVPALLIKDVLVDLAKPEHQYPKLGNIKRIRVEVFPPASDPVFLKMTEDRGEALAGVMIVYLTDLEGFGHDGLISVDIRKGADETYTMYMDMSDGEAAAWYTCDDEQALLYGLISEAYIEALDIPFPEGITTVVTP